MENNTSKTPKESTDKYIQNALNWWHILPIQDLYNGAGWANYVNKYYPDKSGCYHLSEQEVKHIFDNEFTIDYRVTGYEVSIRNGLYGNKIKPSSIFTDRNDAVEYCNLLGRYHDCNDSIEVDQYNVTNGSISIMVDEITQSYDTTTMLDIDFIDKFNYLQL